MDRIDELVEHLATLAGKSDGGLAGGADAKAKAVATAKKAKVAPPAANDGIPAPAANDDQAPREVEQPLSEAVEDFITHADGADRPAPKMAKAYVGHVGSDGRPTKKLNDILPFKWIDLVALAPLLGFVAVFFGSMFENDAADESDVAAYLIGTVMFMIAALALYGAIAFPIRYYLRRRSLSAAVGKYVISTAILFAIVVALFFVGVQSGAYSANELDEVLAIFGLGWLGFTVVAFLIYGVLAGQRAIRSFRSNIRKL